MGRIFSAQTVKGREKRMIAIDMEMPEDCYNCPMNWREVGVCVVGAFRVCDDVDEIGNQRIVRYREFAYKRSDRCPLREVEDEREPLEMD